MDDSPHFLEAAHDYLQLQEAIEVVGSAINADEALEKSIALNPNIILLDLNLGERSGLDLIPAFHKHLPSVLIIVLTIMVTESYRVAALQAGAHAFVNKSLMHIELIPLIRSIYQTSNEQKYGNTMKSNSRNNMTAKQKMAVSTKPIAVDALSPYQNKQALLDSVFNSTLDAIIVLDEQQQIVLFNPAAEIMFQCRSGEMVGQPLDRFMPANAHTKHRELVRAFGESGITNRSMKASSSALTCMRANGEAFAAEISISRLEIEGHRLYAAFIRDVTEHRLLEAALRESEAKFSEVFKNAPIPMGLSAIEDGRLIDVNDRYIANIGLARDQIIGKTALELGIISQDDHSRFAQMMRDHGRFENIEVTVHLNNTREHTILFSGERVMFDGRPRLLTSAIDITEHRRVEAELAYQARLLGQVNDAVIASDSNFRITSWNAAAESMYGWKAEEVLGRNGLEIIQTQWPETDAVKMRSEIAELGHWRGEATQVRKDGTRVNVEVSSIVLHDDRGRITGYVSVNRDISEGKRADEQLHLQDAALKASANTIIITDRNGIIKWANPAFGFLTGYDPKEVIGRNPRELVNSGKQDQIFYKDMWDTILAGKVWHAELVNRRKDGKLYFEEMTITPLLNQKGDISHFIAVKQDITQRKHAEDALRESEDKFKYIFDHSPLGKSITFPEGQINVNAAFCTMFGYSQEELKNRSWQDITHPDDIAPTQKILDPLLSGEKDSVQFTKRYIHKNGSFVWAEVSTALRRDEDGKPVYFMTTVSDITGRKRAEDRVRLQLNRLSALREIDQAITTTFGAQLSLNALVVHAVNLLALDAVSVLLFDSIMNTLEYGAGLGFRTDKVKTANIKLGESYAGRAAVESRIVQIPNLADESNNILLTGFLSGEDFVSYYGVPLIVKGRVIGVMEGFHRSVVERDEEWVDFFNTLAGQAAIAIDNAKLFENLQHKNIELEQRVEERTAELRKANRSKDEFLASMSHELRTPLNAVIGLTESLEEGTYGELQPRQIEKLHTISESGKHLLELINDILDLSKIEAGKLELQPEAMSVDAFCQASISMIKQAAFQKHLQVSISNTSNIKVIHADERRLKQMLVNLLSNAVKFTPENGKIDLEVSKEGDHAVRFSVRDTGIGISTEQLGKLFKPFVQLDSALSRQYTGTGLGLALTSQLADLHGGSVGVESEVGKGSCFYFIIPTRSLNNFPIVENTRPSTQLKPNVPAIHPNNEKPRILLVEDNATNRMVTGEYLNDKGFEIIEAQNGLEAVEQALEKKPALILMDIQMPGISGIEAIMRLRSDPETVSIPIIALTALAMRGDRERCLEAGANEYLAKPVNLKKLTKMINDLLKQQ